MKNKLIQLVCNKCGWEWWPKDPDKKPKCCPHCKRYDYELKGGVWKNIKRT